MTPVPLKIVDLDGRTIWDGPGELIRSEAGVYEFVVPAAALPDLPEGAPTDAELEAAFKRLEPYLRGYPEPMIDARRLRIANGTASEQDRREIAAENAVVKRLKDEGLLTPGW